jgi:predicted PurR-regulated permease PerM
MSNNKKQTQFLLVFLLSVIVLSFLILKPFLPILLLAVLFAVVLSPLYKKIVIKSNNNETLAAWITLTLSTICIVIPLIFLGVKLFNQALQLYTSLSEEDTRNNIILVATQNLGHVSERFLPGVGTFFLNLSDNLDAYTKLGLTWIINHLGVALSGVSKLILDFFIFIFALYYLLKDGGKLKQAVINLSPLDSADDEIIIKRLTSAISSIVTGNLLIAFIQGILVAVGFTIFGIPNSILWGTLTILASLIPRVGTAIITIPGVAYLIIINNTTQALGLFLWGILIVGVVDNILGPKLIGQRLQLHPLFILLSVLGGLVFFGPIGIFLGPLTISLLFAILSIYSKTIE